MFEDDEFRSRAKEYQRMAMAAHCEADRRTWLMLAQSWLLLGKFEQVAEQKLDSAKCVTVTKLLAN
jgi:hypothetical protein